MTEWVTIGGFWVSIFMAIVAIASVLITYIVYRASNSPNVIVYADDDKRRPTMITLVVENIGNGPAKNVTFLPAQELPKNAWGFDNAPIPQKMDEGPIISGIPYLAPKARRVINWGQYAGLNRWFQGSTIDIQVSFERCDPYPLLHNRISNVSTLDVASFAGTDASDSNWDKKIAEELRELNTQIKKLVSAVDSLNRPNES